jgi:hypothetical protein
MWLGLAYDVRTLVASHDEDFEKRLANIRRMNETMAGRTLAA